MKWKPLILLCFIILQAFPGIASFSNCCDEAGNTIEIVDSCCSEKGADESSSQEDDGCCEDSCFCCTPGLVFTFLMEQDDDKSTLEAYNLSNHIYQNMMDKDFHPSLYHPPIK